MSPDRLESLSVNELRALAKGRGIAKASTLRKAELVAALAPLMAPAPGAAAAVPVDAMPAGSSAPIHLPPAQPAPQVGDQGLPIPDRYGMDRMVLMPQDPRHVFVYWEVTPEHLGAVAARAGHPWAAVLVIDGPAGSETRDVDLAGGNYYLAVMPGTTYRGRLALRGPDGRLHDLIDGGSVTTPAAGPSWRTDESWLMVEEVWARLIERAGAPGEGGSSLGRFTTQRELNRRPLAVAPEGAAAPDLAAERAAPAGSSLLHAGAAAPTWSSHSLAPSSASHALTHAALGGSLGGSHVHTLGSSMGSHLLSSHAVGSGHQFTTVTEGGTTGTLYPVAGVISAAPTGLPKAAEGLPAAGPVPAPLPPAANQGGAPAAPAAPAPSTAPAPVQDPLAFIGAPKPPAQRKPLPKR
ncbi:MAG: hypothetical protein RLZZ127_1357 [Planctomycetota bacterium]|jgi:hypothetical protein